MTASLQRTKSIPSLKKLQIADRRRKPRRWQDLKALAKLWVTTLGGEIKEKG